MIARAGDSLNAGNCSAGGCDCGSQPCGVNRTPLPRSGLRRSDDLRNVRVRTFFFFQEYLFDHRNGSMLRDFLVNDFIGGPTGVDNPAVSGVNIDDYWNWRGNPGGSGEPVRCLSALAMVATRRVLLNLSAG